MSNTATSPQPEKLVDIDELIETLWTPKSAPPKDSIYKLAQRGVIPCQKVGRRTFFLLSAVREALAQDMKFRVCDKIGDSEEKQRDNLAHNKAESERHWIASQMREQA